MACITLSFIFTSLMRMMRMMMMIKMNCFVVVGGGMSRSPVTGQDAQEASNGVETSDSPKASDWSGPHDFTHQEIEFIDGDDFELHMDTPALSETLKHTPHHMDLCRDTHTLQSHTDHSESLPTLVESLVQHSQCTDNPTEDGTDEDTLSSETELTHGCSKKELEEWRREEEEEKKTSDGEVNNVNKREIKQRKETLISVQVKGSIECSLIPIQLTN